MTNAAAESTDSGRSSRSRRLFFLTLAVGVLVVVADQLSKWWAVRTLSRESTVKVIGDAISLHLTYNPGAAFSSGTSVTWVFTIVSGIAAVGAILIAWRIGATGWAIAVGLVFGGATTHFGDRLFRAPGFGRGHVVDFIEYFGLFIGNVADIAIVSGACLGVLLVLIGVQLRGGPRAQSRAARLPLAQPGSNKLKA
jgi:signal peptidase II